MLTQIYVAIWCQWATMSFKGLRSFFWSICHNARGRARTARQIPRPLGFDVLCAQARVHCDTNPDRSVLITIITWHFQFHLVNISILHNTNVVLEASRFACHSHFYVTWCQLTTKIVAVLPHAFNQWSKCLNPSKNSTTIKHINNESANIIEGCNVAFDINDCWNFP